jgi:cytochrome c oxidase cbb3-type subunit 3
VTTVNTAAQAGKFRAAGATFNTLCIACHGPDGRGMAAVRTLAPALPDFTSRDWQLSRNKSQLASSIMEGKGTAMPPWRAQVTPELAQDLVAFVRTFGPAGSTAPTTANSEFAVRFKELQKQFEELDLQVQALSRP